MSKKAGHDETDIGVAFLELAGLRDDLQERINNLILSLPFQRDNPGLKSEHPEGKKIYELAVAINNNDQQTRLFLGKCLDGVNSRLKTLRVNKQAAKAYSPGGQSQPWFFDGKR